jgi:hypothetical protein
MRTIGSNQGFGYPHNWGEKPILLANRLADREILLTSQHDAEISGLSKAIRCWSWICRLQQWDVALKRQRTMKHTMHF